MHSDRPTRYTADDTVISLLRPTYNYTAATINIILVRNTSALITQKNKHDTNFIQ